MIEIERKYLQEHLQASRRVDQTFCFICLPDVKHNYCGKWNRSWQMAHPLKKNQKYRHPVHCLHILEGLIYTESEKQLWLIRCNNKL